MDFLKRVKQQGNGVTNTPKLYDPYEESDGLVKKIRKEVILPGVTFYEENRLSKIHDYIKETTGKESTVPQHMLNDIYSMYVNDTIQKKPRNKYNAVKHKVIDSAYNSLTKMISKDSVLFSQIVSRELGLYFQQVQDMIEEEQNKENGGEGGGQGGGPGLDSEMDEDTKDGQKMSDKLDKILQKSQAKLEQSLKKAEGEMKEIEASLGKEAAKTLSDGNINFLEDYKKLKDILKRITINKESMKTVLMKILNKSQNYFSKTAITVEEGLFEAEEIEELFGLEYLHPIFRNAGILDVGNEGKLYTGKIDLYLDCSGSMSSSANFEGKSINMLELVKGIALVLYKMNMIDKLYFFDTSIYPIENVNEMSILSFSRSGGTDFDMVVDQCLKNKRNSVIITDGEDRCSKYARNAFFIGIGGTQFKYDDAFKTYRAMGQAVTYNSKTSNFDYCRDK